MFYAVRNDWFETREREQARNIYLEKMGETDPTLFATWEATREAIKLMREQLLPNLRLQAEWLVNLGVGPDGAESPVLVAMKRAMAAAGRSATA